MKTKENKSSQNTHRQLAPGKNLLTKRPNTVQLLTNAALNMPWPRKPTGRNQIVPITPLHHFALKPSSESQFLNSEYDFKMSSDKLTAKDYQNHGLADQIDETSESDITDDNINLAKTPKQSISQNANSKVALKSDSTQPTILDVITLLQNQPNDTGQYFYLISPEGSGPYDLRPLLELEDHCKLDNYQKFYTLSKKGITTYVDDEPVEFISLNDWLAEKNNFNKIKNPSVEEGTGKVRKMTFFKRFDRWKVIRMWRKKICNKKRERVTQILQDKLFILHEHLGEVIFKLKKSWWEMEKLRFVELPDSHDAIKREEFLKMQEDRRDTVEETIQKYARNCSEDFREGTK